MEMANFMTSMYNQFLPRHPWKIVFTILFGFQRYKLKHKTILNCRRWDTATAAITILNIPFHCGN